MARPSLQGCFASVPLAMPHFVNSEFMRPGWATVQDDYEHGQTDRSEMAIRPRVVGGRELLWRQKSACREGFAGREPNRQHTTSCCTLVTASSSDTDKVSTANVEGIDEVSAALADFRSATGRGAAAGCIVHVWGA